MSDRTQYWRDYHAKHRKRRNAMARKRWREYGLFYRQMTYINYAIKHRLALKVAQNWGVTIAEARQMIEQGRFPT